MNTQNRHEFRDVWANAERSGYMPAAVPRRIHHEEHHGILRRLVTGVSVVTLLWILNYLWQNYAG